MCADVSFIGYFAMFCAGMHLFKILRMGFKYRMINGVAEWLAITFTLEEHAQKLLITLGRDKPKYTNHISIYKYFGMQIKCHCNRKKYTRDAWLSGCPV